ncbi:TetR/AcrR family transcriptional regulator [Lentzea sp.]|uniref:TetR/AcrR family transcriptional regulator n=1 Tax=Lentzea sp. TaxID=56099 RepID=UPI002ED0287F
MKLTAKGRATRQRIIEGAAAHLRGDDAVGVTLDDIRAITGTSKGQIFHYFPDGKEGLFLAVAQFEAGRVLDDQQPHLSALTSWAAWDRWRDSVVARYRAQGRSCPLGVLMGELGSTPGAQEVISTLLSQWESELHRGIVAMQDSGQVGASVDPARLSAALIAGIQGGVQVLRSTGSVTYLEAVLDTLLDHLRTSGLAGPKLRS